MSSSSPSNDRHVDVAATRLLAFIAECCDVAEKHIADHNFGWAEFTMARAQQAADAYATLVKVGL